MGAWWQGLSGLQQIFAGLAIPATVVMVLQSILLLFGVGFGGETDVGGAETGDFSDTNDGVGDGTGDGLALFTVRGIVAFFAVGGWAGMVAAKTLPPWASILVAFAAGSVALFLLALLLKYSFKLQDKGNLDISNAVGKTGKVYIPIPPKRGGQGKITALVQERLVELEAVTMDEYELKTGEMVRISAIVDEQTVLVEGFFENTTKKQGGISKWIQN